LLLVTAVYPYVAFEPFNFQSPVGTNGAEFRAAGGVGFARAGVLVAQSPNEWLSKAQATGRVSLELKVVPAALESGTLFAFADDAQSHNLRLSQQGANLVVQLFTTDPGRNEHSEYWLHDAFVANRAATILLSIQPEGYELSLDGAVRFGVAMPPGSLSAWQARKAITLGNELEGGQAWLGTIEGAWLRTADFTVDYTTPRESQLPPEVQRFRRAVRVHPTHGLTPSDAVTNFFGFMPFGLVLFWVIGTIRVSRLWLPTIASALLSLGLEVTQWWLPGRFPSSSDLILNTAGGAAGAILLLVAASAVSNARDTAPH
jgi:VanZ family protein